jgi:hypothetical protein
MKGIDSKPHKYRDVPIDNPPLWFNFFQASTHGLTQLSLHRCEKKKSSCPVFFLN